MKDLVSSGMVKSNSIKDGVKLLAKGKERLVTPIKIEISRASEEAIRSVEAAGGEITTVHYNRLALRALLKPHKFERIPKNARPPPKWQPYYINWSRNRGYLSVQAQMRDLLKERPELVDSFADSLEALREATPDASSESEEHETKKD